MKKSLAIFLTAVFVLFPCAVAFAEERIVQLTIPGCAAWGARNRIGTILNNVKGVAKYEFQGNDLLIITFDDEVVTINNIIGELNKGRDKFRGKPVYLK